MTTVSKETKQFLNNMFSNANAMYGETDYTNPKKNETNLFQGWFPKLKIAFWGFGFAFCHAVYVFFTEPSKLYPDGSFIAMVLTWMLLFSIYYAIKHGMKRLSGSYRKCSCGSVNFDTKLVEEYYIDITPRTKSGNKDRRYAEIGYDVALIKFTCKACKGYHTQEFRV